MEETTERRTREAHADKHEAMQYSPDSVNIQQSRFEYQYDAYGNWTERIVYSRDESDAESGPSNIERRVITYHRA